VLIEANLLKPTTATLSRSVHESGAQRPIGMVVVAALEETEQAFRIYRTLFRA